MSWVTDVDRMRVAAGLAFARTGTQLISASSDNLVRFVSVACGGQSLARLTVVVATGCMDSSQDAR